MLILTLILAGIATAADSFLVAKIGIASAIVTVVLCVVCMVFGKE